MAMFTYDIAIRYARPRDGKLSWFMGQQLAANKPQAEEFARASFALEFPPEVKPLAIFINRRPKSHD